MEKDLLIALKLLWPARVGLLTRLGPLLPGFGQSQILVKFRDDVSSLPSSRMVTIARAVIAAVVVVTSSPFRIAAVAVVVVTARRDVAANLEKRVSHVPGSWLPASPKSHFW